MVTTPPDETIQDFCRNIADEARLVDHRIRELESKIDDERSRLNAGTSDRIRMIIEDGVLRPAPADRQAMERALGQAEAARARIRELGRELAPLRARLAALRSEFSRNHCGGWIQFPG